MKGSQPSEAEKVSNLVETVVLAAESRKEARHQGSLQARQNVESTIGGHLSSQELSRLTMLCVALEAEQSESSVFGGMETDLLGCLLPHLELHVTSAVSVDLINELERAMGSKEKAQRPNSTAEEVGCSSCAAHLFRSLTTRAFFCVVVVTRVYELTD